MNQKDKNKITIRAYDSYSEFYADRFDSYGIRRDDIDRALKLNESNSRKVLELGCANGRDAQYIISEVGANNYIGIDSSGGLIKLAREKIPNGTFHVKDMRGYFEDIDIEIENFGVIFAFHSMLHVNREELHEILNDCLLSLKIGGILYISSKYGDYREIEIENLGNKKYYYSYKPEDFEDLIGGKLNTVYKVIGDSEYGPSFIIAFKKI